MKKYPLIRHLSKCRVCGGGTLHKFLHLSQMPFTDDFISPDCFGQEFRVDIDIYICEDCWTCQTQHDVDVGAYYEDYQYSVGSSMFANRFMHILAENPQSVYYPDVKGVRVLEIGSGDGEQLVAFKKTGCRVLGYEPSSVLCKVANAKGISTIQGLFTSKSVYDLPDDFREVDVVMLSYTFDHLPNPTAFLTACRSILNKKNGLLVVEVHNLEKIIERQEYCLFEHEHSIYLTELTAKQLCNNEGFEIIDYNLIAEQDRRANSLIFVATPKESDFATRAVAPRTLDSFASLDFYRQASNAIQQGISNLDFFVSRMAEMGKTLAGYGAGGRGIMTLSAMRNASKLRYLADKNPKFYGLVAPKSGIPLVGLDILKSDPVDEILVFSFGYMDEIQTELGAFGYKPSQFHSLLDILGGRF